MHRNRCGQRPQSRRGGRAEVAHHSRVAPGMIVPAGNRTREPGLFMNTCASRLFPAPTGANLALQRDDGRSRALLLVTIPH
jgi:hypothetical protein